MTAAYLSRVCPCCGAEASSEPEVASAKRAESLDYDALVPVWNGFFKEKYFFSYMRCSECGTLYAPTFFTGDQLGSLYAQMPPNMDVVPTDELRKTQKGYFDTLKRYAPLSGGYVEIGPDVGFFTENCVKEGDFSHYWLFEPNQAVAPALHEVMGEKDHTLVHDMFGFEAVPDQSASCVVMVHVLDHLLDPMATLRELRQKMTPGAHIAIVTHDESSLLRRVIGTRWPAFCLQHPQIYNPKSMRNMLAEAGFSVVDIKRTVNHFPVAFLLKHLLWAFGLKVGKVPSFGGLSLGLKLGNMITIATPTEQPS
ncbi:MAG: class I SAM-dependent methyltransferase [Rhodospirillaceae bacterium]